MTTPNNPPNLRSGSGGFERVTNSYQRRLVNAYDSWSVATRRLLMQAVDRGIPRPQLDAIITSQMGQLANTLIDIGRTALPAAARVSVGRDTARTSTVVQTALNQLVSNNTVAVQQSLVPGIQQQLQTNIQAENVLDRRSLLIIFRNQRYRVANYAGGAWAAIFEVQRDVAVEQEQQTGIVRRVRWVINDLAAHCSESPGFFGCPDLEGEYEGIGALPTVPAGQTTCRGNCRCHLEFMDDNGNWQRGLAA